MMIRALILLCLFCMPLWASDFSVELVPQRSEEPNITVALNHNIDMTKDEIWDTYLLFEDSRQTPVYITVGKNTLEPTPLGMMPPQVELRPQHWTQDQEVTLKLILCEPGSSKILSQSQTSIFVPAQREQSSHLPVSAQLQLVQEYQVHATDRYSNYKQFDSRWKYVKMGQYNGTTIGKDGCAMTSAGNIIGWTPKNLNARLQSNGGYYGNLIIWSKVPGLSYKGSASFSSSHFSRYHVIANVGGHFVLLTGGKSGSSYHSKDPGKSHNPSYGSGQIYSVRLYHK